MGRALLPDDTAVSVVTGIGDHSRFGLVHLDRRGGNLRGRSSVVKTVRRFRRALFIQLRPGAISEPIGVGALGDSPIRGAGIMICSRQAGQSRRP